MVIKNDKKHFMLSKLLNIVKKFDVWMRLILRPQPNFFVKSVLIGASMFLAGIIGAAVITIIYIFIYYLDSQNSDIKGAYFLQGGTRSLGSTVIFAPIAETFILAVIHLVFRLRIRNRFLWFLVSSMSISLLLHGDREGFAIIALLAFVVFSYQYDAFYKEAGAGQALLGVTISHALNNFLVFTVSVAV